MLNLIKFEFRRLLKSVFFKIIAVYCVVWPVIVALFYRIIFSLTMKDSGLTFADYKIEGDELRFFTWIICVAFVNELPKFIALFTCLHIGRDYTDGIVRNKIIAGHSRTAIFFSYMFTQIAASVALCITYICFGMLGLLITGIGVNLNGGEMFARFGVAIVTLLVLTVSFVVFSVIFRRRALPIILSIVIVVLLSTATTVVGYFTMSSKAVDTYIEVRHDRYEDMVDSGELSQDMVDMLEKEYDRDNYLGLAWKICHPLYLVTNLGFNSDYSTDIAQMLTGNPDYTDEIDYSTSLASGYFNPDMSGLEPKDFRHNDDMHVSYTKLNLIYIGRSLIWMLAIGGWGYVVFRKKNLF